MRYEQLTIEGRNAVLEAFRAGKPIDRLFILDGCQDGPVKSILREAKKHDTIITFVPKERLDQMSDTGHHQGVIAYGAAYEYAEVEDMLKLFREGRVDEVFLCYTEFISPLQQEPKCLKLLPAHFDAAEDQPKGAHVLTEYDPSPESVFDAVIPEYLYGVLYGAVVESYCSEQSARRMAMEAASDNAGEMIENLNLSYNRARQAAITQEITEIVAGSGEVGA